MHKHKQAVHNIAAQGAPEIEDDRPAVICLMILDFHLAQRVRHDYLG